MIAKKDGAARLGERSLGKQDAGATSCYIILKAIAEELIIIYNGDTKYEEL